MESVTVPRPFVVEGAVSEPVEVRLDPMVPASSVSTTPLLKLPAPSAVSLPAKPNRPEPKWAPENPNA